MQAYIVPLKDDGYKPYQKEPKQSGHILFLSTLYDRVDIFQSNYYYTDRPNPQNRIGFIEMPLTVELVTQWCYAHFTNCAKHPAIFKLDLENFRQEIVITDEYIEDFVTKHYDEIMERLNEHH